MQWRERAPAQVLYGRSLRTKMPEMPVDAAHTLVQVRDQIQKGKGKENADKQCHAVVRNITAGDLVLLQTT